MSKKNDLEHEHNKFKPVSNSFLVAEKQFSGSTANPVKLVLIKLANITMKTVNNLQRE